MRRHSRRAVVGTGLASLAFATPTIAQNVKGRESKPHVVVIGGGAGGASVARHIAEGAGGEVDITLVEAHKTYQSCFFSNHYLGGFRAFETLTHSYKRLQSEYGVAVLHDRAVSVDRAAQKIELERSFLRYDLLVLAPGIDFVEGSVNGWSLADSAAMPHAYKGGVQIRLLRQQIEAMPKGGVFAMVVPDGTYRCPPGPYERATIVAHMLKQTNPTAKIVIADPKALFSKMSLFREAWRRYYKGMIDFNSDVDMAKLRVDPDAMTLTLDGEVISVDAANVIPNQKAGVIAEITGITQDGWAPVFAQDMRSKRDENIYVLGDAAAQGDMPKSAFAANSQAKVCADAILARLLDRAPMTPAFANTCWSMLAPEDSVKIGAAYEATPEGIARVEGIVSKRKEEAALRRKTHAESLVWYDAITRDMFG